MKMTLLTTWSLVAMLVVAQENGAPNAARRISAAEVETVRLEVEQTNFDKELQIRVRDYAAFGGKKDNIACEVRSVGEDGKERRIRSLLLKRTSATSSDFSGSFASGEDFAHGQIIRIVYRSEVLKLPVSTWLTVYFQ